MKKVLAASVLFCLLFCKQNVQESYSTQIIGDWESISNKIDEEIPNEFFNTKGYSFLPDGTCEVKGGIINHASNRWQFLNPETKYTLTRDKLRIFDPGYNKWASYHIKELSDTTLVLDNITFVKKNFNLDKSPDFDAVIVASSGCFGYCPVNEIMIDKNGGVSYHGHVNNLSNGSFVSTVSRQRYKKIMLAFKKADYLHLQPDYSDSVTDHSVISISFIKDGRIIKSISDYAQSSPQDFIWAYNYLTYLSPQLTLTPMAAAKEYFNASLYTAFESKEALLRLTGAESFFLLNELKKSKEVFDNFHELYTLSHYYGADKISTDGRYYRLQFSDKTVKTLDLGYNFLTQKFVNQFKKKNE